MHRQSAAVHCMSLNVFQCPCAHNYVQSSQMLSEVRVCAWPRRSDRVGGKDVCMLKESGPG